MKCPTCGKESPHDPETGYDGNDYCSRECEEIAIEIDAQSAIQEANDAAEAMQQQQEERWENER
jgi:endogenous inhibitor of DNA gyrase (YacG/DUF329 family)